MKLGLRVVAQGREAGLLHAALERHRKRDCPEGGSRLLPESRRPEQEEVSEQAGLGQRREKTFGQAGVRGQGPESRE